ncbi:MAG: phosphatidylserine decarboxylase [Candidatus Tectimicrobiota bacterium]
MGSRTWWLSPGGRLAPEGLVLMLPLATLTAVCFLAGCWWSAVLLALISGGVVWFFRAPERLMSDTPEATVAPAHGRVLDSVMEPEATYRKRTFLSPLAVHTTWAPCAGVIRARVDTPGMFLPAYRPEASDLNASHCMTLVRTVGQCVVKRLAGVLARRVVCHVRTGDVVRGGETILAFVKEPQGT